MSKHTKGYLDLDLEKIAFYYEQGYTQEDLARMFYVSRITIRNRLIAMGITLSDYRTRAKAWRERLETNKKNALMPYRGNHVATHYPRFPGWN